MSDELRMIQGPGDNLIPDVPLGRAWIKVLALITEQGGVTISRLGPDSDLGGSIDAFNAVAERIYHLDSADLGGFSVGNVENALEKPRNLPDHVQRALTGAVAGAVLTGIQFERDRLAAKRREERGA